MAVVVPVRVKLKDNGLFLTANPATAPHGLNGHVLYAAKADDTNGTLWRTEAIPGSTGRLLVKNDGTGAGMVLTWGERGNFLTVAPRLASPASQTTIFMDVGEGYYAINNPDESLVMDRSDWPEHRGWIIAYPWNGGDNQRWAQTPSVGIRIA